MDITGEASETYVDKLLYKYVKQAGARLGELRVARDLAAQAIGAIDSDCTEYGIELLKKIIKRVHKIEVEDAKEMQALVDWTRIELKVEPRAGVEL